MFFFTAMIATILMLLLLPNTAFSRNRIITTLFILLCSTMYFYIIEHSLTKNLFELPLLFIAFALVVYLALTDMYMSQRIDLNKLWKTITVITAPLLLCFLFRSDGNETRFIDILILLLIFRFAKSGIINQGALLYKESTIELYAPSIVLKVLILFIFLEYRRIPIDLFWINSLDVLVKTLVISALSCFFTFYLGYKIGYFSLNAKAKDTQFKDLVVITVFNFWHVAIAEEVIFRGFVYNYLRQIINYGDWPAIILSTLFFGYQHINYAGKRMFVIATIAGFFYCLSYTLTNNLFAAVIVHTITNIVWRTFFILIPGSDYIAKSNLGVRK